MLGAIPCLAGEATLDLSGRFAALDVLKPAEAERVLGAAAAGGFRVLDVRGGFRRGWTVGGYAALLERSDADVTPAAYELVIRDKVESLEDGLNDAAMRGFHLRRDGFFFQRRGVAPFQDGEFVAVMERSSKEPEDRHYRVLAEEDLDGPLRLAVRRGYEVVGFAADRDLPVTVLEIAFRPGDREAGLRSEEPYRLLEVGSARSLRRRLADAVADRFRLIGAASPGGDSYFLLGKDVEAEGVEYRLPRGKDLLHAINEAGAAGFRLLPFTLDAIPVLERVGEARGRFVYQLVGSDDGDADAAAWSRELDGAVRSGFRVLRLTAPFQALLERDAPPN